MPARVPLPPQLAGPAFRTSAARALGVSTSRLRGADLARPFTGVRSVEAAGAADYAPLLRPGDRFSHETAAALWPLPLPGVVRATEPPSIHLTATAPRNPPRGRGVVGHVGTVDRAVWRHGLPLSDPVTLFIELATVLDERDLVAVGDALVLDPHELDPADIRPWIVIDELRRGCAESHLAGCRIARRAAARVRVGAESATETHLRLLLDDAGLPEPELNVELYDDRGWMGRFDLVYADQRVIVEYDGDQHRTDRRQYERDITRIDRAIAAGWTVVRVRARGLYVHPAETIDRVRRALSRRA